MNTKATNSRKNGHSRPSARSGSRTRADWLPHDPDAERTVLGTLVLFGNRQIDQVLRLPSALTARAAARLDDAVGDGGEALFFSTTHEMIFGAVVRLLERGALVGSETVAAELHSAGLLDQVGGLLYLAELPDAVFAESQLPELLCVLLKHWSARATIRASEALAVAVAAGRNLEETLDEHRRALAEVEAASPVAVLPERRTLAELPPREQSDPAELIRDRAICRGSVNLLVAPTGIGKSTFVTNAAICWALGHPFFGLDPVQTIKTSVIQAENDWADLGEMGSGVVAGMQLSSEEAAEAAGRVVFYTVADKAGDELLPVLRSVVEADRPDLLVIDPAFAYIGGDALKATDVAHFMRHILIPLAQRHTLAILVVHHTNKPPAGKEKSAWAAGDFAYLGAGSGEWCNAARMVLAIRSLGSESVFELRAAKRGGRLRWLDENGERTTSRYIAHDGRPGVLCWRDATAAEVAALDRPGDRQDRKTKVPDSLLILIFRDAAEPLRHKSALARIQETCSCSRAKAAQALADSVARGLIEKCPLGYRLPKTEVQPV